MFEKDKKTCMYLNYVDRLIILASTFTGCVSISAFTSLVGVPVGTTSSAEGLEICAITERIKKHNSSIY